MTTVYGSLTVNLKKISRAAAKPYWATRIRDTRRIPHLKNCVAVCMPIKAINYSPFTCSPLESCHCRSTAKIGFVMTTAPSMVSASLGCIVRGLRIGPGLAPCRRFRMLLLPQKIGIHNRRLIAVDEAPARWRLAQPVDESKPKNQRAAKSYDLPCRIQPVDRPWAPPPRADKIIDA
jgi:hypothetical protein